MKKLIFIFALALALAFTATAQRTITDDVEGAEIVYFSGMTDATQIQVLATNVGGTTEGGTCHLQGSVDGVTYINLQPTAGLVYFFPSDTALLTGYTWEPKTAKSILYLIDLENKLTTYLRLAVLGTSGDTTTFLVKWRKN